MGRRWRGADRSTSRSSGGGEGGVDLAEGIGGNPVGIPHAAAELAGVSVAAVVAEQQAGAIGHLVIGGESCPVGMDSGEALVAPIGDEVGGEGGIPETDFINFTAEVLAAGVAAEVKRAIQGGGRGAAGDAGDELTILIGGEQAVGVDKGDMGPLAWGEVQADEIQAAIGVPDPQFVLTIVVGASDAKRARSMSADDEFTGGGGGGRTGNGRWLYPHTHGFAAGPSGAAHERTHAAQVDVIAGAIEGQGLPGTVGGGRTDSRDGEEGEEKKNGRWPFPSFK